LRVTGYELRGTGCGLRVTGCELRVAGLKVKNDLFAYSLEKGFGIELFADIQTG